MRIAIDMDDVLADSARKAVTVFHKEHGFGPSKEDLLGRDLHETLEGKYSKKIVSYFYEKGFLRDVPLMPDCQDVVKRLYDRYEVFIVSAATEMPYSLEDKFFWLEEFFPFISFKRIVFCGDKRIINADVMIDDRSRNFEFFTGRPLLFTAHHNLHETRYERVNNWKEIEKMFLEI